MSNIQLTCYAVSSGLPILVILMIVGVINPSGVDPSKPKPAIVQFMKQFSPFAAAIEALCLGEYPGMQFVKRKGWFQRISELPRMGGLAMVQDGDQVIEALGLSDQTYRSAMTQLALLTAFNLAAGWLGLLFQQHFNGPGGASSPAEKTTAASESSSSNVEPVRIVNKVRL